MKSVDQLSVKIFADGADLAGMLELYRQPYIKGFTTNPTLMRKAGITDYRAFAQAGARRPSPTGRSRSKCSRMNSTRWNVRRARSPAGATAST